MISGVYKITSLVKPDRCYIGSSQDIYKRWEQHIVMLSENKHHSSKLQRHFNKYGKSDLQFTLIVGCDCNDLISTEQYFIDVHIPYFNGRLKAFNNGGYEQSESEKQRKREAMLGEKNPNFGRNFSEQHRKRISDAMKGKVGNRKGKEVSDETRRKLREVSKGQHRSPETQFKKGHVNSEESRKKVSEALKGRIPWNKGKPYPHKGYIPSEETREKKRLVMLGKKHTPETKRKMSEARSNYYMKKRLLNFITN